MVVCHGRHAVECSHKGVSEERSFTRGTTIGQWLLSKESILALGRRLQGLELTDEEAPGIKVPEIKKPGVKIPEFKAPDIKVPMKKPGIMVPVPEAPDIKVLIKRPDGKVRPIALTEVLLKVAESAIVDAVFLPPLWTWIVVGSNRARSSGDKPPIRPREC